MGIEVSFNTDELTLQDREVLARLIGVEAAENPEPAKKAAVKKKPVEKAAPEPETDEDDEDLVGAADEDEAPTMEDVVARATAVVQAGHAKQVKETLVDLGVAKVSQLKAGQFEEFLTSLADIDV